MRSCNLSLAIVITFVSTAFAAAQVPSRSPAERSPDELTFTKEQLLDLIRQSRSPDLNISHAADEKLSHLGTSSASILIRILKNAKPCEAAAAGSMLVDLKIQDPEIVPALVKLTRGGTFGSLLHLQEEMMCRRSGAYLLARSTPGLNAILDMLRKGDTWEKETAAFALDDLTESNEYPAGSVDVMKQIIAALASCQNAKDEILQNMSGEVLGQVSRGPNRELAQEADKLISH